MHLILVGIQGSGKGTQARYIVEKYGCHFFEMGQKLRDFSLSSHPKAGDLKSHLAGGNLASDELVISMLESERDTLGGASVVFDGIPRTPAQLAVFERVFPEYFVVFLDLPRTLALERLSGRRIDPTTGEAFPADFKGDFSPMTGVRLLRREDDTPEAAEKRIKAFYENTLPLLAMWAEKGKRVYTIDASQSIEEVRKQIDVVMSAYFV